MRVSSSTQTQGTCQRQFQALQLEPSSQTQPSCASLALRRLHRVSLWDEHRTCFLLRHLLAFHRRDM